MNLEDVFAVCDHRNPTDDEIHALIVTAGTETKTAVVAFSLEIARRFMSGAVSFDAADAVMNSLFAYATKALREWPEPMYSVYLAFDNGEFHHRGDDAGTDPVEKYTRPQLAELLAAQTVE